MKKAVVITALLLCIFLPACSGSIPMKGMSPAETVSYYFEQFNSKKQENMDAVTVPKMRGAESDLKDLAYVKLISCEEEKDQAKAASKYNTGWYDREPYKIALVYATFDIAYKNGSGGGFSNGRYSWEYYLIKETDASDWMIVQWGI